VHVRCPSSSARAVDVLSLKEKDEITWGVGMAKSNLNPQPHLDSHKNTFKNPSLSLPINTPLSLSLQPTITNFLTLPRCGLPSCPSVAGWIQHRKAIVISTAINQTNHLNISWGKLLSLEDLLVFFSFFFFETSTFLAGPHKFLFSGYL